MHSLMTYARRVRLYAAAVGLLVWRGRDIVKSMGRVTVGHVREGRASAAAISPYWGVQPGFI